MPLLANYHAMQISIDIDPFPDVEKLARLTQLYLEPRLPLYDALRAAEADLWQPEDLDLVIQSDPASAKRCTDFERHLPKPAIAEASGLSVAADARNPLAELQSHSLNCLL